MAISVPQRRAASRRSRWRKPNFTHAFLLVFGFFYMYPFLWMIGSSLKTPGEFFSSGLSLLPASPRWANYPEAWTVANFGTYFLNTVAVATASTLLVLLLTAAAGYVMARTEFPGKRGLAVTVLVLFFLPHGYTIIPLFDLVARLGLLNTLWAVILALTAGGLIGGTFLFAGYFSTLPRELEDAAFVDGANLPITFWRVMLPQAKPMAATVGLLHFMGAWNAFFIPLVFTLGNKNLRTLPVGMQAFVGENSTQWTWVCAGAVITVVPVMLVFFFLQRYFVDAIAGAVKG